MANAEIQKDNAYAVITGASGGLGTSFALECAKRGYNLLLVALPHENLHALAHFIQRNFPVKATGLELDISDPDAAEAILDTIQKEKMQVSLLINNAGLNQNELFENTDGRYMRKLIELNCIAVVSMTKALLPELKKQPKSNIISVSSLGGFYALPRKTCYTSTKGFVRQFSQSLRMEVAKYGVTVSVLCPGAMTTNIGNYILHRQLNWLSQKTLVHPHDVAAYTLRKALQGKEIIIPGRMNRIIKAVSSLIPSFVQKKLTAFSMKQLEKKAQAA